MSRLKSRIEQLFAGADRREKHHDIPGALDQYQRIIDLPDIGQQEPLALECAHFGMAELLIAGQEMDRAVRHLKEAIRLNPGEGDYRKSLGEVYIYQGKFRPASLEFIQALKLQPGHPPTMHLLGWSLFMAGERAEGRRMMEQALELDDTNAALLNDLAACLAESGQRRDALRLMDRACAIDPGNELYKACRDRLREKIPGQPAEPHGRRRPRTGSG
jgi:Flp pilus assembly protein TadD